MYKTSTETAGPQLKLQWRLTWNELENQLGFVVPSVEWVSLFLQVLLLLFSLYLLYFSQYLLWKTY